MRKLKYIKLFENLFEPKEDLLFHFNGGSFKRDSRGEKGELVIEFPSIADGKSETISKLRNGIDLVTKYLNDEKPIVSSVTGRGECTLDATEKKVAFEIGSKDTFYLKKTGSSSYEVYVPTKFGFTGNKYIDISAKNCIYKMGELVEDFYR